MRRLFVATAVLITTAAGIASASVVSSLSAQPLTLDGAETLADLGQIGETVPDPRGGPPWAARISTTPSGQRCVTVGRTDGQAFGPVDATGHILDIGRSFSGSCADPAREPLQVAVARYADTAGTGPRSVLFGVADKDVVSVAVTQPGGIGPLTPDRSRTFVVVREELARDQPWTVIATLSDGTQHAYSL